MRGQWTAEFIGLHRAETIKLFGTATLPTPYTLPATRETVVAAIQAKNPGAKVI